MPIDFEVIVYGDHDVPGGMIGSSQALLRELTRVAPRLGIEVVDGTISEATARQLADAQESDPYFFREKIVWGALFSHAQVSVQHRALLSFSSSAHRAAEDQYPAARDHAAGHRRDLGEAELLQGRRGAQRPGSGAANGDGRGVLVDPGGGFAREVRRVYGPRVSVSSE